MPDLIWKPGRGGQSGHPVWFPGWAVPRILAGKWPNGLLGLLEENEARIHVLELEGEHVNPCRPRWLRGTVRKASGAGPWMRLLFRPPAGYRPWRRRKPCPI